MFEFLRKNNAKKETKEEKYMPTSRDILYQLYDWADERDYEAIDEYLPKVDQEHYISAIMGICFSLLYTTEYENPYEKVEEYLNRIGAQMKTSAAWYYDMAYALLYQGKYEKSCDVAYEGIEVVSQSQYLWLIYSKALYCAGKKEAALDAAEHSMKIERNDEIVRWIELINNNILCEDVLDKELPYMSASNDFTMPDEMRMRESHS